MSQTDKIKIFWDPKGFKLDSVGKKTYLRATDGDTPYVSVPIRMLSIDTPEVHYPGNQKPSKHDEKLKQLADWINEGKAPIGSGLSKYLYPKLATSKAGTLQEAQGEKASAEFKKLLDQELTRPSGSKRKVFLYAAEEHFDGYGRLLAYMAPSYTSKELKTIPYEKRATFNLKMVESGWAAPFLIYPSLPRHLDLERFRSAGKEAYDNKRGAWEDTMRLTGYEFRMCVKLYNITKKLVTGKKVSSKDKYGWVSRYCADMTTREVFYPQDYFKVEPYNSIFIWPGDISEAVGKMNLSPP